MSLLIAEIYPEFDAAIGLYLGAPLLFFAGLLAADVRAGRIFRSTSASLMSIYEFELKARYTLHEALWGHPTAEVGLLSERLRDHVLRDAEQTSLTISGPQSAQDKTIASQLPPGGANSASTKPKTKSKVVVAAAIAQDECDALAQVARRILSIDDISETEAIFVIGCAKFRQSPILHVFVARFYSVFGQNKHLQMR